MTVLDVRHTTIYRYSRPVMFGDHRLMLRPRDSHDLRLIETNLTFSPSASVRWFHDVFGNSVAIASFAEPSVELRIVSSIVLETYAAERPPFQISPDALSYPFIYSADDRIDLGRMLERQYPDPNDRLGSWARGFVRSHPTDTSALLADLNSEFMSSSFVTFGRDLTRGVGCLSTTTPADVDIDLCPSVCSSRSRYATALR